jgi:2-iminobutanoate/2-iminopropanoate deaminase
MAQQDEDQPAEEYAFNAAYREFLAAPYPARTTVGSTLRGILVEVDVIAVLPAAQ